MTETFPSVEECLDLPVEVLENLFSRAYSLTRERFSDVISFHMPGMRHYETDFYSGTNIFRFPSVSVTGTECSLNCEHCRGKLLESMLPARTPEQLWEICLEVVRRGGKGILVSGGSTRLGNTPISRYTQVMKRVKRELGLHLVVHTGIVYPDVARGLADAGVDGAMIDIIGDRETLHDIYHLDMGPESLDRSMDLLEENGVEIVPHVVVGLYFGRLRGEGNAIRLISRHKTKSVVVVAFMPLDETPMTGVRPPEPIDIARVLLASRFAMPERAIILGCARPLGEHRVLTDRLAIDAGVSAIAYPTPEAFDYARKRGLRVVLSDECCSLFTAVVEAQ